MKTSFVVAVSTFAALLLSTSPRAETIGRITGVGGVFITSKDPKAIAKWYKDVLGITIESWGGAILR